MYILVAKEKHDDRYLVGDTPNELAESCLKLIRERREYGWYDDEETSQLLDEILDPTTPPWYRATNPRTKREVIVIPAWRFIQDHSDFEYEHVERVEVEQNE